MRSPSLLFGSAIEKLRPAICGSKVTRGRAPGSISDCSVDLNQWLADQGCINRKRSNQTRSGDSASTFQHRGRLREWLREDILRHLLQMIRPDLCVRHTSPLELVLFEDFANTRSVSVGLSIQPRTVSAGSFGTSLRNKFQGVVPGICRRLNRIS